MSKIRQILRMHHQGRSMQSIAAQADVSRNTARKYIKTFQASGFAYEEIRSLNDKELEDFFGTVRIRRPDSRLVALQRCFPQVDKELKRTGTTRMMLWESYFKEFPDGFKYSQFCFYYNQWKARVNPVMYLEHKAGDKLYVDFAGEKLSLIDSEDSTAHLMMGDFFQEIIF